MVLGIECSEPVSARALAATVHVAQAFHAEVECLLIEDRQLFDVANYTFAREVSAAAPTGRGIDIDALATDMRLAARGAERNLSAMARDADVPVQFRPLRDAPVKALADACQAMGPWNAVALSRPLSRRLLARTGRLFDRVTGMTGVVMASDRGDVADGPVVAVVEDFDRLAGMRRTAERLARVSGRDVRIAIIAATRRQLAWLEREVRQSVAGMPGVDVVPLGAAGGGAEVAAEALRRINPSFVVAAHGGQLLPAEPTPGTLADVLASPLLIVR